MELYQNPKADIEERIADLLSKMTVDEKVHQIDQYSGRDFTETVSDADGKQHLSVVYDHLKTTLGDTGIGIVQLFNCTGTIYNEIQRYAMEHTRLGIPILFCQEALHGLGKTGATVFPQQSALGATFAPELGEQMGHVIAAEARASGIHETWNPVLDLAREPRWGRTEENLSEDTYLSSRFAAAIVRGMQGDDLSGPDRVASEPKHYTAYGSPLGGLNCAPCSMGRHDVFEACQPVFEAAFTEGGAMNVMCSYSSIDGTPLPADHELLTDVLRGQWGMRGYVRSDMCAISMLNCDHNVADTREEAIRMALEAGVDVQLYDFPHDFYQGTIKKYAESGVISMETLDRAVGRVLRVKFMLGLFDHPFVDETLEPKVFHCKEHQEISLNVARQAVTLLKNENNLLPLAKNLRKIAVIGPAAACLNFGDYSVSTEGYEDRSLLTCIRELVSADTEVVYVKGCEFAERGMKTIPASWFSHNEGKEPGLVGTYYNNPLKPEGDPVLVRTEPNVDFHFIATKAADCVDARFSAVYTGTLRPDCTMETELECRTEDSVRLYLDGVLVFDTWGTGKRGTPVPFTMEKGRAYDVKIVYRNDARGAELIFGYQNGISRIPEAVALAKDADVVIAAVGENAETSGENFDRSDLNLPGKQEELVRAVAETGTPMVLVLHTGRPMSIAWEDAYVPAIVSAWYPGERGEQAAAEVLFGDVNPSGRLPMSFPKTVGQIPVFYSRKPAGAKHYVGGPDRKPLYPFGYGLSYTTFAYDNLRLSADTIGTKDTLTVSFDVTNTGDRDGYEVAQVYIRDYFASVVKAALELKGFEKVFLRAGETKTVSVELGFLAFRTLNPQYQWQVEPGKMRVMVGRSAEDLPLASDFEIV